MHHAGLSTKYRQVVEILFRAKHLRVRDRLIVSSFFLLDALCLFRSGGRSSNCAPFVKDIWHPTDSYAFAQHRQYAPPRLRFPFQDPLCATRAIELFSDVASPMEVIPGLPNRCAGLLILSYTQLKPKFFKTGDHKEVRPMRRIFRLIERGGKCKEAESESCMVETPFGPRTVAGTSLNKKLYLCRKTRRPSYFGLRSPALFFTKIADLYKRRRKRTI